VARKKAKRISKGDRPGRQYAVPLGEAEHKPKTNLVKVVSLKQDKVEEGIQRGTRKTPAGNKK